MDLDMHVLVVDDYSTMRRILRSLLQQIGFKNIDEAGDGGTALAKLRDSRFGLRAIAENEARPSRVCPGCGAGGASCSHRMLCHRSGCRFRAWPTLRAARPRCPRCFRASAGRHAVGLRHRSARVFWLFDRHETGQSPVSSPPFSSAGRAVRSIASPSGIADVSTKAANILCHSTRWLQRLRRL